MLKTYLNLPFNSVQKTNNISFQSAPKVSFRGAQDNLPVDSLILLQSSEYQKAKEIWAGIEKAKTIVIQSHMGVDGDALSSGIALLNSIKEKYPDKQVHFYVPGSVPSYLKGIPGFDQITTNVPDSSNVDLAISLDCNHENIDGYDIYKNANKRIRIDHHPNVNKPLANEIQFVDSKAPSTTAVLYHQFFKPFGIKISPQTAECILTGLITDTGRFRYATAENGAMETCDEILSSCAKDGSFSVKTITDKFDENKKLSQEILDLKGNLKRRINIQGFTINMGQKVNYIVVPKEKLKFYGVKPDDADLFVMLKDTLGFIANRADIAIILRETANPNEVHVGMKSNFFEVRDFIKQHGGGGHIQAGSFTLEGSMQKVLQVVLGDMKKHMFRRLPT